MRKRFNVTGSCNPERHYMVETEKRFKAVEELIDNVHTLWVRKLNSKITLGKSMVVSLKIKHINQPD